MHVNVIALSLFVLFVAGVHFTLSYIQNDYFLCKSMNEIRATGTYTCHVPPTSHARSGGYTGRERGGWTDGRDGWTGWMEGWTDGWMHGWMDGDDISGAREGEIDGSNLGRLWVHVDPSV